MIVQLHDARELLGVRLGADQNEDGRCGDVLALTHSQIFQSQKLEAIVAPAVDHPGAKPDLDIPGP